MSGSRKRKKPSIKICHDSNFNCLVSIEQSDIVNYVNECQQSSSTNVTEANTGNQVYIHV